MAAGTVVAMVPTVAQSKPEDECEFHAQALARALMKKHGSVWKVNIDSLNEFVLIYREVTPKG